MHSSWFGTERGIFAYIQPPKDFLLKKHTLTFVSGFPTPLLKIPAIVSVPAQAARASPLCVCRLAACSSSELLSPASRGASHVACVRAP